MFIGREKELDILEHLYAGNQFECVIVYGRRRVGKTTLINHFCQGKPSIYFTGIESSSKMNLEIFSQSLLRECPKKCSISKKEMKNLIKDESIITRNR